MVFVMLQACFVLCVYELSTVGLSVYSSLYIVCSCRRDNSHVALLLGLAEEIGVVTMEGHENSRDRSQVRTVHVFYYQRDYVYSYLLNWLPR